MVSNNMMGIPERIKELREVLGVSAADIAEKLEISEDAYLKCETGETDIPISQLFTIASCLNVDFTVLLTGEDPKMKNYAVTRGGRGIDIQRFPGYEYISLSHNYIGRKMEPLLVVLSPDQPEAALVCHSGQEFNYVLDGTVKVTVGQKVKLLEAGDCIYFDPRIPHGQQAVGGTAKFLTIIME